MLADISAVRQSLLDAFAFGGPINIDMSNLARIDVSFVQLVVAAARTAGQTGSVLTVSNVPDAVTRSFQGAGFDLSAMAANAPH